MLAPSVVPSTASITDGADLDWLRFSFSNWISKPMSSSRLRASDKIHKAMKSARLLALTLAIAVTAMTSLPAPGASASEALPEGGSTVKRATRICAGYARAGQRHFRHLWPVGVGRLLTWYAKASDWEGRLFRKGSHHLRARDWPTPDKTKVARWLTRLEIQASLLDERGKAIRDLRSLVRDVRSDNDLLTPRQLRRRDDSDQRWSHRIDRELKRNARLTGDAVARLTIAMLAGRQLRNAPI